MFKMDQKEAEFPFACDRQATDKQSVNGKAMEKRRESDGKQRANERPVADRRQAGKRQATGKLNNS